MDTYSAIRLNSLNAVISGDNEEYVIRVIFRWYAKTFFTPLHVVEELPIDDILIAYYETMYENMKPHELEKEKEDLLESDEDRISRLRKADEDRTKHIELSQKKEFLEKLFVNDKKRIPGLGELKESLSELSKNIVSSNNKGVLPDAAEQKTIIPEGISMTFLDDDVILPLDGDPLEGLGLLDNPKRKQS